MNFMFIAVNENNSDARRLGNFSRSLTIASTRYDRSSSGRGNCDFNKTKQNKLPMMRAARPRIAMHHRETALENVHGAQTTLFENVSAAHRFQKGQAQQQMHVRYQIKRMADETISVLIGRIRNNRGAVDRRFLQREEVGGEMQVEFPGNDVASNYRVPAIAQDLTMAPLPALGSQSQ